MTQEKRENFMFTNDTIFYKKLLGLMLPMMLQNLMLALVAVADAFMLGGMDQNYMSAVSLATQIQFIQNMLLSAATGGLAILGAQYWGRGNIKTLDDIFCMALRLCGLVSIAFFIACICFPQYLMLFFTDEPVLIGYGVQYLRIAGFSYLLTGISQCYLVVMKISEHALTTALISSATVGINIALNAILIYGKLGITPMGVRGAATATLSARMIELACCILISSRPGYIRPYLTRLFQRNRELARDFRKCAMPILGASLFWGVGFTSYSSFMGHLGVDAAAANSVAAVREFLAAFKAWLPKTGKSEKVQAAVYELARNKASVILQADDKKERFAKYLTDFAETLTEEQAARFTRPLLALNEACEAGDALDDM